MCSLLKVQLPNARRRLPIGLSEFGYKSILPIEGARAEVPLISIPTSSRPVILRR
jgi:hypothetical protein